MTDETPEQKLRARVMSAWPNIAKWDAAMDLYGRERYFAGKVEGLRSFPKTYWQAREIDGHGSVSKSLLDWLIQRPERLAEAEAEYAACVAEIQEEGK